MVAKFLNDNKPKIHLLQKVNSQCFKLHRSYSISFNLSNLGKIFWTESERTISELRKRKRNFLCYVHLLREVRKFHVTVMQQSLKNVQKNVMHVRSCCFTNINLLLFLPFSLPSLSSFPKLPFVVIKKFCYHGNVTSHFSLFLRLFSRHHFPGKLVVMSQNVG